MGLSLDLIEMIPLERLAEAVRAPSHYAFQVACPECESSMQNCLSEFFMNMAIGRPVGDIPASDLFRCPKCKKSFEASLSYKPVAD